VGLHPYAAMLRLACLSKPWRCASVVGGKDAAFCVYNCSHTHACAGPQHTQTHTHTRIQGPILYINMLCRSAYHQGTRHTPTRMRVQAHSTHKHTRAHAHNDPHTYILICFVGLRITKAHVTHPELKATFCLDIIGIKKNPNGQVQH